MFTHVKHGYVFTVIWKIKHVMEVCFYNLPSTPMPLIPSQLHYLVNILPVLFYVPVWIHWHIFRNRYFTDINGTCMDAWAHFLLNLCIALKLNGRATKGRKEKSMEGETQRWADGLPLRWEYLMNTRACLMLVHTKLLKFSSGCSSAEFWILMSFLIVFLLLLKMKLLISRASIKFNSSFYETLEGKNL